MARDPSPRAERVEAGEVPLTVLVVDDHRMVLLSTRLILSSAGFRVFVCDRGEQVLPAARRERPDVILLDVMMPGTDGWETLSQLKAHPDVAGIPVVVFTAREYQRGQRLAGELGAAGFVSKPYDADHLSGVLREHAGARRLEIAAVAAARVPS